ncbi:MAG TPA: glutathione S-transferase family protein [Candidatus Binataceae bacterium]|nr:glutathione S-transferase family protein [Candidatus Binataceae bacterium]
MAAKLYQFIGSPYCAKVRKLLAFKGIETEIVEVDYIERKELLVASGQIMVPAVTLDSGETIADSAKIALRLEELFPEPTIFPPGWRGVHLALADYFDTQLEDVLYRAVIADELAVHEKEGEDRAALWRLIRERKYGAGFVDRMIAARDANFARAKEALVPFEEQLEGKPFLTGRIGLADFALYGQLFYFGFTGELKIPSEMKNLRAYFARIDRITSNLSGDAP